MLAKIFKAIASMIVLVGMPKYLQRVFSDICIDFIIAMSYSTSNDHSSFHQFYSDLKFLQNNPLLI